MGGFYDSIHIRSESSDYIRNVLADISKREGYKFFMSKPINGWIGVFPDNYGQVPLADAIANMVNYDVLRLVVHDDDVFCYWYYRDGKLVDEYNSCPDYFGEKVPNKERKRLKGRPEVFAKLVDGKKIIDEIRKILRVSSPFGKIKLPKKMKEFNQKMKSFSKELDAFFKNPEEIQQFLAENPQLMEEQMKSLLPDIKERGLSSQEEIQNYLEQNFKVNNIWIKLAESFIKKKMNSDEYRIIQPGSREQKEMASEMEKLISGSNFISPKGHFHPSEGFFASEQMHKFANALGIQNAVTSYEYLADGEVENIIGWEDFIQIP